MRILEDGDFVFGHTEYNSANRKVGFEALRFEARQSVEHWDNTQEPAGSDVDGGSVKSGPTDAYDHAATDFNRAADSSLIREVFSCALNTARSVGGGELC